MEFPMCRFELGVGPACLKKLLVRTIGSPTCLESHLMKRATIKLTAARREAGGDDGRPAVLDARPLKLVSRRACSGSALRWRECGGGRRAPLLAAGVS
eukprot:gene15957-biopygen12770